MKIVETHNTTKIKITCDECGTETNHSCYICEKDVCITHSDIHPEDWYGDNPRWLCNKCYEIGKPFLKDLEILLEKWEEDKELILQAWTKAAKI